MTTRRKLIEPYRIDDGRGFRLRAHNPGRTRGVASRANAKTLLEEDTKRLEQLQDMLYASGQWALLLIFQGMDASGKDGVIKHVMSGVNPQGCQVVSFKQPSAEELRHDFMWRSLARLPERGRIGIFNRSYYEEVLVVRVHPEVLAHEPLPKDLVTPHIWKERYEDIAAVERYLTRNGVAIRKFFLHVSRAEQKRRFMERLEHPEKNWKFAIADVEERRCWKAYQSAYEDMIRHTSAPHAPWIVVPADHKWYARLVVSAAVVDALESLKPSYPKVEAEQKRQLASALRALRQER